MYKQIIIARKDLNMSPGKLAAQVSHASMAFLTNMIQKNSTNEEYQCLRVYDSSGKFIWYKHPKLYEMARKAEADGKRYFVISTGKKGYKINSFDIEKDLYEQWINGEFTKCILEAKNKNQLLKAKTIAEELGMKEGYDFFVIRDNCHTELEPEEDGRTLTCIGFRPMDSEVIDKIGRKYQLYK